MIDYMGSECRISRSGPGRRRSRGGQLLLVLPSRSGSLDQIARIDQCRRQRTEKRR